MPQTLELGDVIKQINPPWNTSTFQKYPLWKLIRREDNGANFSIKFWAVKVPEGEEDQALAGINFAGPVAHT